LNLGSGLKKDRWSWVSDNEQRRIAVLYKHVLDYEPAEDVICKIVAYSDLPERIIDIFSSTHEGILPCLALSAISTLRNKSGLILNRFNQKMDVGFMVQRALCSNPQDASTLLYEAISTSVDAVLQYADIERQFEDTDFISSWISSQNYQKVNVSDKDKNNWLIDDLKRLEWLKNGVTKNIGIKYNDDKTLLKNVNCIFTPRNKKNNNNNEEFAILSHHKSKFMGTQKRITLSLGSVVRKIEEKEKDCKYYLCIQQKCDSLRLTENRRFLFLPLKEKSCPPNDARFDLVCFVEGTYKYFEILQNKCFHLCTFEFQPSSGKQEVLAVDEGNSTYFFTDASGKKYLWVFELKELYAQAILNNYASKISRVGINQSEWLRIGAKVN